MKERIRNFFLNQTNLFIVYSAAAVLISLQQYYLPAKGNYTHYENYLIFKNSFFHLLQNQNLYANYPAETWDLYKYSPSFSFLFGPFTLLPDSLGLICWNLLNALVLFSGIISLPLTNRNKNLLVGWAIIIELITSLQNSQSNPLIAGLILLCNSWLEKRSYWKASLAVMLSFFIKIFGLAAGILFVFKSINSKSIFWILLFTLIIAALPLFVINWQQLAWQYQNWFEMLKNDHSASLGLSVIGFIQNWFGIHAPKNLIVISGTLLLSSPMIFFKHYQYTHFRLLMLASVLLWMVLFNHKAESPTFIIAVCGAAVWYISSHESKLHHFLFILLLIFTCLSSTDIFPPQIRKTYFIPYGIKVLPCILIWLKILYDQWTFKPKEV